MYASGSAAREHLAFPTGGEAQAEQRQGSQIVTRFSCLTLVKTRIKPTKVFLTNPTRSFQESQLQLFLFMVVQEHAVWVGRSTQHGLVGSTLGAGKCSGAGYPSYQGQFERGSKGGGSIPPNFFYCSPKWEKSYRQKWRKKQVPCYAFVPHQFM